MAFDDFEKSVQDSTPVELYTFVAPSMTLRITSFHEDVSFGGNTYTAEPASRSNLEVTDLHEDQFDATVELPASHALVQHYANGIAPREVSCLIQRYQPASGLAIQMWFGYVESLAFKKRMGSFRIPSAVGDALDLTVPGVVCSRLCNHVLYDVRCGEVRTDFDLVTTVATISADGRTITTVGSVPAGIATPPNGFDPGGPAVPWSLHGELLHGPSGERRTITVENALNSFTLQCEFGGAGTGITVGDAVTVFAGCDHSRGQCKAKFANVLNFGGHPDLPRSNIFYVGLRNTTGAI